MGLYKDNKSDLYLIIPNNVKENLENICKKLRIKPKTNSYEHLTANLLLCNFSLYELDKELEEDMMKDDETKMPNSDYGYGCGARAIMTHLPVNMRMIVEAIPDRGLITIPAHFPGVYITTYKFQAPKEIDLYGIAVPGIHSFSITPHKAGERLYGVSLHARKE